MITFMVREGIVVINGIYYHGSYSGHGEGLDNPDDQDIRNVGPLPLGQYQIGEWHDDPTLGPNIAKLTPLNIDTDRSGFYWHGDNRFLNHTGSDGCLVSPPDVRHKANQSGDNILEVVA